MTAQICPRLEVRPCRRVAQQLRVRHRKLVQLGPAVDGAPDEADRLNDLQTTGVVKVAELNVPSPTAPRQPELLAAVHKRSDTPSQCGCVAAVDEDEVAFFK